LFPDDLYLPGARPARVGSPQALRIIYATISELRGASAREDPLLPELRVARREVTSIAATFPRRAIPPPTRRHELNR